jgi:hypothetical protein
VVCELGQRTSATVILYPCHHSFSNYYRRFTHFEIIIIENKNLCTIIIYRQE